MHKKNSEKNKTCETREITFTTHKLYTMNRKSPQEITLPHHSAFIYTARSNIHHLNKWVFNPFNQQRDATILL